MIFVTPILVGGAAQNRINPRTGTVGLLFTTSIEKKNAPTSSTAKVGNAQTETARHCRARNASRRSFLKEAELSTQIETRNIRCGAPRFTRWVKWASSAWWP